MSAAHFTVQLEGMEVDDSVHTMCKLALSKTGIHNSWAPGRRGNQILKGDAPIFVCAKCGTLLHVNFYDAQSFEAAPTFLQNLWNLAPSD
jgi:hypothetical protein